MRIISVQGPIFYGNSNQTESAQKVVLDVQKALNLIARRTVVPEDGIFDKQTVDQLRLFQASHRIVATGAINNDTIERLNRQLAFLVDEAEW